MKKVNLLLAAVVAASVSAPALAEYTPNAHFFGYMRAGVGFDKNGGYNTQGLGGVANKVGRLGSESDAVFGELGLGADEAKLYKELGVLTKEKEKWEESIPYVSSLLNYESVKIQAKVLWLLGEMGLLYPQSVQDTVPTIVSFLDSPELLLRERAVNALGRIGRGDYSIIESYWASLFRFASDEEPKVRLAFIWASENIATNTPDIYENYMSVFEKLLHDVDDKVRMEAPEIFRVLGKRRPEFVRPYVEQLRHLSGIDENRVVRIHCLGAIRATGVK